MEASASRLGYNSECIQQSILSTCFVDDAFEDTLLHKLYDSKFVSMVHGTAMLRARLFLQISALS